METLISKASTLTTEMIMEILEKLSNDFRDGVDLVEDVMLDELEKRLSIDDFVEFVEAL